MALQRIFVKTIQLATTGGRSMQNAAAAVYRGEVIYWFKGSVPEICTSEGRGGEEGGSANSQSTQNLWPKD